MQLVLVKKEEFYKAQEILSKLFPAIDESKFEFENEIGKVKNEYYFIVEEKQTIGVLNAYCYDYSPKDRWLGWFGIMEKYRNKRFGSKALSLFENNSKERNFSHTRVFTDKFENDKAIAFYEKNGYQKEDYFSTEDVASSYYKILIFSKNLVGLEVEKWNGKNINLTLELKKQL